MNPPRSQATEEKILQTATQVFLERGKQGARMQEIADRAGINKALLHYYFRSKERLYAEVFRREIHAFLNTLLQAIQPNLPVEACLKDFINRYIDYLSQNTQLVRFFLWEIESGAEHLAPIIRQMLEAQGDGQVPLLTLFQNAVREGSIRALDPVHTILSLIGMCIYPFLARPVVEHVFPGIQVNNGAFLERRKQEVFALIWHGLKPEEAT